MAILARSVSSNNTERICCYTLLAVMYGVMTAGVRIHLFGRYYPV